MIDGVEPGQHHRDARRALEAAGWRWHARGDWAQVYVSPDGNRVARTVPFDPAYALHVETCLAHPDVAFFQRIDWCCDLAPAGQLVVMERLAPADSARARALCGALGETKWLKRAPRDGERLAWADARLRDPALGRVFEILRAAARAGARRLGWWGGLDVRPANVLQDAGGRLVLIDPYFVAGPRLIPAILADVQAVGRHYSSRELRGFLEIAVFEDEADEPGEVLQQLRAQVAVLEASEGQAKSEREQGA